MLDCEPSENEEHPSEMDNGGVSAPELEVHVLERERVVTGGRVKTGSIRTENRKVSSGISNPGRKTCMTQIYLLPRLEVQYSPSSDVPRGHALHGSYVHPRI